MPLDIDRIRRARPANAIFYYPTINSTMIKASVLASSGAADGTVILADEQTAGVGRLGRSWASQAELGIYCSMLLRLNLRPGSLPLASLVLGLAAAEAIQKATEFVCDLRWPNDVLIHEKKVAGILTHLTEGCIIAGIGINVNQTEFPSDLRTPATSLRIESKGCERNRETLIINLLESIDTFRAMLETCGPEAILRAFTSASSYVLHRRVVIEESGERGITAGLDQNGFLLVNLDRGKLERVAAGGVRPDV
ncbi:MAG TPA: biotin--[acetyl-CoA-carboxylase] ligase [Bryobacteraceae bacterium]|nr:biotin--[acetyl-CoA-carboxylase] ligase [Bryobacteraceae bacterium]